MTILDEKAAERFHAKTCWDELTDCIIWTAGRNWDDYGSFKLGGKTRGAHRVAYEQWVGPIPPGFEVDHLCKTRACVNPFHLEAVTHRENWRRSNHSSALPARTGRCKRGHDLTAENLVRNGRGLVTCGICKRERHARPRH